jgi:hypothetical protein
VNQDFQIGLDLAAFDEQSFKKRARGIDEKDPFISRMPELASARDWGQHYLSH